MTSIDKIHKNLVKKLTADGSVIRISRKLSLMKSNDERVLYVYDILEENKMMPEIVNVSKDKSKSTKYRLKGNESFAKKNDSFGLQYYNLSILHAPNDSEELILAYANRSAVLFSMQYYAECIKDIDKVFSSNYPEKLKAKLENRRSQCEDNILKLSAKEKLEDIDIFKPFTCDKTYKCASDAVEVKFDEKYGRHVIAKRDLRVGEVLCVETPYSSLLLFSQYLFRCSFCLKRNCNLMPCNKCCYAMYCSESCQKNAWIEFHEMECPLMATLYDMQFTKLELLALRIVIKAVRVLGFGKFQKLSEEMAGLKSSNDIGCVNVNGELVYDSKYYQSIHALASNIEHRTVTDIFQKCVTAAVLLKLLNRKEKEIAWALLHHGMTVPTNIHSLSTIAFNDSGDALELIEYGAAAFAFLSLLNHSCSPNIVRKRPTDAAPDVLAAVTILPIKQGEQILDNYGYHHAIMERKMRQASLKWQYKFDCMCVACENDWPVYAHLKDVDKNEKLTSKEKRAIGVLQESLIASLQAGTLSGLGSRIKSLCVAIAHLAHRAPIKPLADCQEALKQAFELTAGIEANYFTKHFDRKQIEDV